MLLANAGLWVMRGQRDSVSDLIKPHKEFLKHVHYNVS